MRTRVLGVILFVLAFVLPGVLALPTAQAHAELRQSSPAAGEVVGGEFHQIGLLFSGLDTTAPQQARVYDPAGNLVREDPAVDGQRMILSIEPLTVPGEYLVVFEVNGIDGDFTEESFSFFYDPSAPEPEPVPIPAGTDDGFDIVGFGLLLAGAAIAAFLVQRFITAWREHRAAQAVKI